MYHIMVQIYLHGVFGIWESVDGKFDHHCIALHCAKPEGSYWRSSKENPLTPGPKNSRSKPCSGP